MISDPGLVQLRGGGQALVLDGRGTGLPEVVHWGPDLGDLSAAELRQTALAVAQAIARGAVDRPVRRPLLRQHAEGHPGRPGLSGERSGRDWSPLFRSGGWRHDGARLATLTGVDEAAQLYVRSEVDLAPSGVLRVRHVLRNTGAEPYRLNEMLVALPLPPRATELLDLSGRWARERQPQRHPLPLGSWVRESRRGRTGHDATPALLAGTPGFGARSGEVWALHVAWSGNHVGFAERWPSGEGVLGGGELLWPGEVELDQGEEYATPWIYAAYSSRGLDGISSAFHRYLRARPGHPKLDRPRPVVLNTWEAVYFDHGPKRLFPLVDAAAEVGVERFVLDDGWFRGRRDDTAGLGDWYVDETVWPGGLDALIERVRAARMQFGLWVEPEMVNPDSDLYRAHPDWILRVGDRIPLGRRNQHVLDLSHPAAYEYVRSRLATLLAAHHIDFLKWDHNRDLVDAGRGGHPATRAQTLAVYRLIDEVRRMRPGLEIESCSSGGARIDLGIVDRVDRVWPSDSLDALERQTIQRWTGLLLPPELVGTHVGPTRSRISGRTHDLSFRAVTALFGHAGIEWDITEASPEERTLLANWIAFYKEHRELLHTGDVVHADHPDPAAVLHGVVSADRSGALYAYIQMQAAQYAASAPVVLPGLDPERTYRIEPVYPAGRPRTTDLIPPPWYETGEVTLPGSVLGTAGLAMPGLKPEQALLLRVETAQTLR